MDYKSYQYLYPPRPANAFSPLDLPRFEGEKFLAQPKLNGSCLILFTDGKQLITMNRRKELISNFKMDKNELLSLHSGEGWMVLVGEYMNKSQRDEDGRVWNIKLALHDILVYHGKFLLGYTIEERQELLDKVFTSTKDPVKPWLYQITENVFRIGNIYEGFPEIFEEITKWEMYEGLVLKRKKAKLELATHSNSNTSSQIKCRKPTKNYVH